MSLITKQYWWQWNTFDEALNHALRLLNDRNVVGTRGYVRRYPRLVIIKEEHWDVWYQVITPFEDQDISKWNTVAIFSTVPCVAEEALIYVPEEIPWQQKLRTWLKQKTSSVFSRSSMESTYSMR